MEKDVDDQQLSVRGDGKLPSIAIEADTLADATYKAIIACHDYGARVETPKQRPGMPLGRDANMVITVKNPDAEPKVCTPGMHDSSEGMMQYILEVTHGIHNHWKKTPEEPHFWGYTYHERFIDQIPFVLQRIKADWDEKKGQWHNGNGRPSGRDYQFAIWRAGEDIILEQEDPPCWQLGQLRFLQNSEGGLVMNYQTNWRSRDLYKAWNENNIAQVELMKHLGAKVSDMLQVPVELGSYTDHSDSLHLYGAYYAEKPTLEGAVESMKKKGCEAVSMSLDDYFMGMSGKDREGLKRFVAAQGYAEAEGHGKQQPEAKLVQLGFDPNEVSYPSEWGSWDPRFDSEPNPALLARVMDKKEVLESAAEILGTSYENLYEQFLCQKDKPLGS
jgi:hypothetical protein